MPNLLDQFTRETIEIVCFNGNIKACGWRFREFHLRDVHKGWRISHIPSGRAVPFTFAAIEDAAAAAIDLDRLRNRWDNLEPSDAQSLKPAIEKIAEKHRGKPSSHPRATEFRNEMNGYGGQP